LGHIDTSSDLGIERQADDQVERWGFKRAYQSYEKFEGQQ
jgi:hypothetical protein